MRTASPIRHSLERRGRAERRSGAGRVASRSEAKGPRSIPERSGGASPAVPPIRGSSGALRSLRQRLSRAPCPVRRLSARHHLLAPRSPRPGRDSRDSQLPRPLRAAGEGPRPQDGRISFSGPIRSLRDTPRLPPVQNIPGENIVTRYLPNPQLTHHPHPLYDCSNERKRIDLHRVGGEADLAEAG